MMRSGRRSNDVVGLRFLPTDEELVIGYLLRKLTGLPLLSDKYVFDCDLYGSEEPWEVWARFRGGDGGGGNCSGYYRYFGDDKDGDLYFFTPLKKKTPTAIRFERTVGSNGGSWHGEDTGKVSTSSDGRISWIQKRFSYESMWDKRKKKRSRNQNQNQNHDQEQQLKTDGGGGGGDDQVVWIMHEYSLNRAVPSLGLDGASYNRYALCRIRKKDIPMSKKRKLDPAAAEPPRIFLVEIDEEKDDYFSQDETDQSAPPATITTTTSFSDHYSVSPAAAATTSSGQSVAPDSGDYLGLISMDPADWAEAQKELWKFLGGDEFGGASADFCCQSSNALPLSC